MPEGPPLQHPTEQVAPEAAEPEPLAEAEVPEAPPPATEAEVASPEPDPGPDPDPDPIRPLTPPPTFEPVVAPPEQPQPRVEAVELPEWDGKGLIQGAILSGVAGWGAALGTTLIVTRGCVSGCGPGTVGALIGFRWVANGASLGLAIPAGLYRGQYDAAAGYLGVGEVRDHKRYIRRGAIVLGLGAGAWIVTRFAGLAALIDGPAWNSGSYVAYFGALQLSWTATSAGAGLLSYGLSLDKERKRIGKLAGLHVVPQLGRHDAGLSLAGRF